MSMRKGPGQFYLYPVEEALLDSMEYVYRNRVTSDGKNCKCYKILKYLVNGRPV